MRSGMQMLYSTVPPFKIFFNIDMKELRGNEEVIKKNSGNRKRKVVVYDGDFENNAGEVEIVNYRNLIF